jgi:hypothetical protein
MPQRHLFLIVVMLIALAMTTPARAGQGPTGSTQSGTVSDGANKYYSFTPSLSGQFTATLSWDNQPATLFLVLVCGSTSPMTFGVAAGQLDRFARLESGVIGTNPCLIGVSTTSLSAAYRLNLQRTGDELATPQTATFHGIRPSSSGPLDARLIDEAERTLAELKAQVR